MKIYRLIILLFLSVISTQLKAQIPSNDDPCNAAPLTVGTTCVYTQYTNANATATAGVPAPGCANYSGGDVWFSVTVPASGSLIFDSNTGVMTDGGMAIYSGTCASLNLIACNDDGSANGLMPSISQTGLTPGSTIYIRFWSYGNSNNGTFSICVRSATPCSSSSTNATCATADPFCTGTSYDYCNTTGVPSIGSAGIYGCLLSAPNPAFYFLNVQTSGPIIFNIAQQTNAGVGIDVDFVLWGPFASQAAMCGGIAASNIVDCSYSTAAVETATITNAVAGQWYMLLITNFSDQAGSIQFSQTNSAAAGAGTTNCNILTAVPGPCVAGLYTLSGTLQTETPPTTGTVTITSSCGGNVVYNAPFPSSLNYTIPGLCGSGNNCTVSAVFSAAGAPTILPTTYTATNCNSLTAVPGPCVAGAYTLTGTLITSCLPATGTLTITTSCGGSVVYNAPFTNTINYSIPGINGAGGTCTVTAVYSDPNGPTITPVTYTGTTCCSANAGTTTVTVTNGTQTMVAGTDVVALCPGGTISLVSNNDFTLPPSYDPGFDDSEMMYAIYTGGGPTTNDPANDPHWTGFLWTDKDFSVANSGGLSTNSSGSCSPLLALSGINAINNTLVFVPITADDGDNGLNADGVVAYDQNGDGCYALGEPFSITFLNPIVPTTTPSCGGVVNIQLNGGYPQFFPGNYTVTNTGAGTLTPTTINLGGTITISGLTAGQTYSYSVNDGNGCVKTFSGVYSNSLTVSIAPANATVCAGSCVALTGTVTSTSGNVTFTNSQCIPNIPDGGIASGCAGNPTACAGTWASSPIVVSGVCDPTWNTGDLLTVCLNISHTFDSDLSIWLQAPNGVYYLLTRYNGGGGNNYNGTCFSAVAATSITAGAAPFAGSYKPQGGTGNFAAFNGTPINGTWTLWMSDDAVGDIGEMNSWSITFNNPNTYTYAWTPAAGLSATNTLTPNACPAASTVYTLTVTNACGCTATATVPITVTTPVTPLFNPVGPICSGSAAPVLPLVSTNGITGTWAPAIVSNTTTTTYTFTPAINQCATTTTLTVTVNPVPTVSSVVTQPLCNGDANGSINLTVLTGTAPFTYVWSNGALVEDINGLIAGSYTVTVTGTGGCTVQATIPVTQPNVVTAVINPIVNNICNGGATGSATVTAGGGTPGYTYLWSNGSNTTIANGLAVGNYTITVTDSRGCTKTATTAITQPTPINLVVNSTPSSCGVSNGTASVVAAGGTGAYTYLWSPSGGTGANAAGLGAGGYTIKVTDANGCTATAPVTVTNLTGPTASIASSINVSCFGGNNGSATSGVVGGTGPYSYVWSPSGGNGITASNLSFGNYTVTITDASGCSSTATTAITQPTLITTQVLANVPVSCFNTATGSATVTGVGGTPGYTYLWSNGNNTAAASGLLVGTYTVTITDSKLCIAQTTINITQPPVLTAGISASVPPSCNGAANGTATAVGVGGTAPYSYLWSNGNNTANATGLGAALYIVTVTDANGCTAQNSVNLIQPTLLTVGISASAPALCNGGNTGTATAAGAGGTAPYSYLWSNGNNTANASGLTATTYTVTVTDAHGCTAQNTVAITQPPVFTVTIPVTGPISCNGGNDGTASALANGGTPGYTYLWSNGSNTANTTGLSAATYTVTATDLNGCTVQTTINVTQPTQVTAGINSILMLPCNGGTNGTATALAGGGTPGYTYLWSNGSVLSNPTGLSAATYTLTVTDSRGCTATATATISEPPPMNLVMSSTPSSCGVSNGTATVVVTGAVNPVSFLWTPSGGVTASASGLIAGGYSVKVTDGNGCTATGNITVNNLSGPTASIASSVPVSCFGGNNGSATAGVVGGTTPYTYQWSPSGGTGVTASNLSNGNYTLTITDAAGCSSSAQINITQPTLITAQITATVPASCFNTATGSATASGNGGTPGYTYLWSNGNNTATANGLLANTYTVTVTDANLCTAQTTVIITQPPVLTAGISASAPVTCNGGADGSATALAAGGTGPYSYLWSNGSGTPNVNGLIAGIYTLTVTDANGCTAQNTVNITQPTLLTAGISANTPVTCNGGTNGTATALGAGGTAPYSYLWSNGNTTANATGLSASNYVVTVTDANGCTAQNNVNITQPTLLTVGISANAPVTCNGGANGTATALAANGTPGYTYLWSNGNNTANATGLSATSYTVTATDLNGCTAQTTVNITQPTLLTVGISASTPALCTGNPNGSATALAANGTPGYTYSWSNGNSTANATALIAGTYTVTATDANGCSAQTTVVIAQPAILTVGISAISAVTCSGGNDGSATANGAGGTAPYSYIWSNGNNTATANGLTATTYTVTVTDFNGCTAINSVNIIQPTVLTVTIPISSPVSCNGGANGTANSITNGGVAGYTYLWSTGSITANATGLSVGTYTITVTDSKGCTAQNTVNITEPALLTAGISASTPVSCNGGANGSATAAGAGGVAGYTYLWSNGNNTATASGLSLGTYTVTVTDSKGCTAQTSINITEPTLLTVGISASVPVTCNGGTNGTATALAANGTPGYTYLWSNGNNTANATNLSAATYTVTATDLNGCTAQTTVNITQPTLLTVGISASAPVTCNAGANGSATALAANGTPGYSYLWSNGNNTTNATNLSAATYTVTATDLNGCTAQTTVNITQPTLLTVSISASAPVTCNGGANGSATALAANGTPGYTYLWSNGNNTTNATNLSAATYTVTATDLNGCTAQTTVNITQPTLLTVGISASVPVTCNGGTNGSATALANNGTPGYTYVWSNGNNTANATNLSAATYTVTATDLNGCTAQTTVNITQPTLLTVGISASAPVTCNGGANGSATALGGGGTAPYSYLWSNGNNTANATNLSAATYTVTATDLNGCTAQTTVNIAQPTLLAVGISASAPVTCNGGTNGSATALAANGTPGYTYLWSNGNNTANGTNLSAATYTVTATDLNGCTAQTTVNITQPTLLTVGISASAPVTCNGGTNGSATALAANGIPGYTYLWSNGNNTANATNLSSATYTVTATDLNGCTAQTTVNITQPTLLTVGISASAPVTCNGGTNGTATALAANGTPGYTYLWSNGNNTANATNLSATTYTVTATDLNGCTAQKTVNITEPTLLTVGISASTPVSCNGGANGSATALGGGGTAPYSYLWSNGNNTASATNLSAATYTVAVTDLNGCTAQTTINITQPTLLTVGISASAPVTCNGGANGSATALAANGTPGYSYLWSNGNNTANTNGLSATTYTVTATDLNGCTAQTTVNITQPTLLTVGISASAPVTCNGGTNGSATALAANGTPGYTYLWSNGNNTANATNLSATSYTVTATDLNGCTAQTTVNITQPTLLTVGISASAPVTCNGGTNGSATALANNGTPGYAYLWSNGNNTANAMNLLAATYTVTATDLNGCTAQTTVNITQPTLLTVSISASTPVSCNAGTNGTASALANGGTAGYTYFWSNGNNTANAIGLSATTYTVTVTDAHGCTAQTSINITQPTAINLVLASTPSSCGVANGTASVIAAGGTGAFTYLWAPSGGTSANASGLGAGGYTVKVTDANGCNVTGNIAVNNLSGPTASIVSSVDVSCFGGNNGSATSGVVGGTAPLVYVWSPSGGNGISATNLTAGNYTVTITDASGCSSSAAITINQPTVLTAGISANTPVSCKGGANGSATVAANGGTAPYSYLWSNGNNAANATGLSAATYTVTVTDAKGCTAQTTVIITEPTLLTAGISASAPVTCNGGANGSATVLANGGTPGYTYFWSNGNNTATANGLTAAIYTVTVTDANGCTAQTTVNITQPTLLTVGIPASTPVSCNGAANGTATALAANGTPGYSYLWSNGNNTANATGLSAATYTVTATDANGCIAVNTVIITQSTTLAIAITSSSPVSCNGGSNGTAAALANGGTPGYTYLWSNGNNTTNANGLSAATYTVTATDTKGCTAQTTVIIAQPTLLTAGISASANVTCNGGNNGSATTAGNGGTPGYSYLWSNGNNTATANGLTAATYTVTVTDANGCTAQTTIIITQPALLTAGISASTDVSCNGGNNGSATALANGGTAAYTYFWSNGNNTATANGLSAATYTVTVTDSKGCTAQTTAIITQPTLLTVGISANTPVTCNGGSDGTATALAANGTPGYTYLWSNGNNTAIANGLSAITYTVTATDSKGCIAQTTVNITQPVLLTVGISANTPVLCNGGNNGTATALANGGTAGYSYLWSNGNNTATANGLSATTYTVTVTDSKGCTAQTTATIAQPTLLTVGISANTPVSCNGGANGSATALAANGTAGYTYLWSNGNNTATASGLSAATYTVTATDSKGCTASTTVVIAQPAILNPAFAVIQQVNCFGGNTGSISTTIAGGSAPYIYQWSTGNITSSISNLTAGPYTVTVTDAKGCNQSITTTITEPAALAVTLNNQTNVNCFGGSNASVSVNVTGGTPAYSYLWSNGGNTSSISGLASGSFTVTVTDAHGCNANWNTVITQPIAVTVSIATKNNVNCFNGNDGNIQLNVNGGNAVYNYQWSPNVSATSSAFNLIAGNYTATVTDGNGCSAQVTTTITQPAVLQIGLAVVDVTCNGGSNGTITANVNGGTAAYSYLWSPSGGTNAIASGLSNGNYTVTVTDANGCTAQKSGVVNQAAAIVLNTGSTAATCGQANGSVSVNAAGGAGGFTYLWSPGNAVTANVNNMAAGGYQVTVTDANNCTATANVGVPSIGGPTIAIASFTDVSCFGGNNGTATVNVSAGNGPYIYNWLPSGGSTATASNLSAGNYNVNVTDINGCIATVGVVIGTPTVLNLQTNFVTAHCGQADGSASVIATGGTAPYTYLWSGTASVTANAVGLIPGNYTITVTDSRNCTSSAVIAVPNVIAPTINILNTTPVSCFGSANGQAFVAAAGGVGPYSYLWSNGNNTSNTNGLSTGNYTVTATDVFGCSVSTVVNIATPTAIVVNANSTPATCGSANGTAQANANGGTSPYAYSWSSGGGSNALAINLVSGAYTVTVTDANGCTSTGNTVVNNSGGPVITAGAITNVSCNGGTNGSAAVNLISGTAPITYNWFPSGGNTANATNLSAGNYTINVTDANGCISSLNMNVVQPQPLVVNNLTTDVACAGGADGTATIDALGGTSPYIYDWNPGGILSSARINLSAGNYVVTVTDANGCTGVTTATVNQPLPVNIGSAITNANCNGSANGSIVLNVGGGISPYNYSWSTGATGLSTLTSLTAGSYTVTVSDNNGCPSSATYQITEPTVINIQPTIVSANCGTASGSASVVATGGSGGYVYLWSTGSVLNHINNVLSGNYTITVTDVNGCAQPLVVNVPNAGGPTVAIASQTNVKCNGLSTGIATVNPTGGVGPYNYNWLPSGGTSATATNLAAGNYTAIVTDANGCQSNVAVQITQPTAINLQVNATASTCGNANGTVTSIVNGGTVGYTYLWSNASTSNSQTLLNAGTYTLTVSDGNGCTTSSSAIVQSLNSPTVAIASQTNVSCNAGTNGSATVNVTTGNGPYQYNWTPSGGTSATATNLAAGNYIVNVTDANGCVVPTNILITQPTVLQSAAANIISATCGNANGSASVNVNGGTPNYNYQWSNGALTQQLQNVNAGTYTVTATDAHGCTTSTTAQIQNAAGPLLAITSTADVSCNNGANGSAQLNVTNGTGALTYVWSNGNSGSSASNLIAGNYTVTVSDINGCSSNVNFVIHQPAILAVNSFSSPASCNSSNGSAGVIANGGTPGYTYLWNNGVTNSSLNNIIAGNYTVTVTDLNGCVSNNQIIVANVGGPTLTVASQTNVLCNGLQTGQASVSINGGTGPFNYTWNPVGGNSASATNLAAGNYTVNVVDANGCIANIPVQITQPTVINIQPTIVSANCGTASGSASVVATGGSGGYVYLWSTGSALNHINNVLSGNYTITVTDVNGCAQPLVVNVPNAGGPTVAIASQTNVKCNGLSTGIATVNPTGGVGPYNYNWLPSGGTSATATNLAAGNYTAIVTDANGCQSNVAVQITQPTAINLQVNATASTCGNANGTVTSIVNGGTVGYTYLWSNASTSNSQTLLNAGTYTLTVSDGNGCTTSSSAVVQSLNSPTVAIASQTNVSCNAGTNGSATINVTTGNGPYNYNWTPSGGTSATATNLAAGNYTVNVTDANGCVVPTNILITQPTALQVSTSNINTATCGNANGSATATANGGTSGYNYLWSNGNTTSNPTGLIPATYTVTVTDAHGCISSATALIPNAAGPLLAITNTGDVSCNNGTNGSAQLNVTNGTGALTYIWSNGNSGTSASNLIAGNYTVTVSDINGCSSNVNFVIHQPTAIVLTPVTTSASCNSANGSAGVNVNGGTPGYTYLWNNGVTNSSLNNIIAGNYTVTVTDLNGCVSNNQIIVANVGGPTLAIASQTNVLCNGLQTGQATVSINGGTGPFNYTWSPVGGNSSSATNLAAGNYTVNVVDANGCIANVPVLITQPTAINIQSATTPANCNSSNGSASAIVNGGTGNYIYNWSTGSSASTINSMLAGPYTITITDQNNCTSQATIVVPGIGGPTVSLATTTDVHCNGGHDGSASVNVTNGSGPYSYVWYPVGSNNNAAANLYAANYSVTVTDINGCLSVVNFTIHQPTAVTATASGIQMATCFGYNNGQATINPNGGTGPYTYLWSNGFSTNTSNALPANNYVVTVTDFNGCTGQITLAIAQPNQLNLSAINTTGVTCYGGTNGHASVNVVGGTTPYNYAWPSGTTTSSTSNSLPAGNYNMVVTDNNGCNAQSPYQIGQPSPLVLNAPLIQDVNCFGGNDGSATLNPTGSTSPYSYQWSNGNTTISSANLIAGNYTITVTDLNGCSALQNLIITEPPVLALQSQHSDIKCYGELNGTINIVPTGGTSPYNIQWSGGATGFTPNQLGAGNYSATITDAHNCVVQSSWTIIQPAQLNLTTSAPVVICIGQQSVINAQVTGGTPNYSYQWSNGFTGASQNVSPIISSNYTVTVTDANGCTATPQAAIVNVNPPLTLNLSLSDDTICEGQSVHLNSLVTGGNGGPYTYFWSNSSASGSQQTLTPGVSTSYMLTVSDGCGTPSAQQQVAIVVNPLPLVNFVPDTIQGCIPVVANLTSTSQTTAVSTYQWNFGDNTTGTGKNTTHLYTEPGSYNVSLMVTNSYGCTASVQKNDVVTVHPNPIADFTADPMNTTLIMPTVNFFNQSSGAASSMWHFGDGTTVSHEWDPSHTYRDTGNYSVQLIVTSQFGCKDTAYREIIVSPDMSIFIPNAFSPNQDHLNEGFTGYGVGIAAANFTIYDRWGKLIYTGSSLSESWNGTFQSDGNPCPEGVYIYLFNVTGVDGNQYSYKGRVTLIR